MFALTPYEDELARAGGWTFVVPPGRRPRLRLEAAQRREAHAIARVGRVVADTQPCAWFAIESYWERVAVAQRPDPLPLRVMPPITARAAARPASSVQGPLLATLEALEASALSPLHPGLWWIGTDTDWPFSRPWVDLPELIHRPRATVLEHFEWRLLPLRPFSGGRRVEFWQKQLRAGVRPPAVVLAASIIEMFVILDGHDRLEAAHREAPPPVPTRQGSPGDYPLIILAPLRRQTWAEDEQTQRRRAGVAHQVERVAWNELQPLSQRKLNDAVIQAWVRPEHHYPRSRCWPVPGGFGAWQTSLPPGAEGLRTGLP